MIFFNGRIPEPRGQQRQIKSCVGSITIASKQSQKLGLRKSTRLSPHLEKCCLLLVSNKSFANAEQDLELLTGVRVPHSTQHRLVERYQFPGHDGIWNLIGEIGQPTQRREVLDWFHLVENLYKVGGSTKRLKRVKNYLWSGQRKEALASLEGMKGKAAQNFRNYLNKHCSRIPNYQHDQEKGMSIGSGAVESLVKQIGARVKIVGAQWNAKNVSQILKLRCAYLNGDIQMSICA